MFRKFVVTALLTAVMAAVNAGVRASTNDADKSKPSVAEQKDWRSIAKKPDTKAFDPASSKSTMSDYNQTKKATKKFSTTAKVLIGVGVAAAVLAVVFVAARNDLKDNILR